jgi:hypothetical protein
MARADLDTLLEEVAASYRADAVARLDARNPGWRAAVEAKEREVGELFAALCAADATVRRWRRAVGELGALWAEAREAPEPDLELREVA